MKWLGAILAALGIAGLARRAQADDGGQVSAPASPPPPPPPSAPGSAAELPAKVAAVLPLVRAAVAGTRWRVPEILAVIEIESSFDPRAYRAEPHLGDASRGLMQLLLSSARDREPGVTSEALYDPATNIRLGVAHLEWTYDYLAGRRQGIGKADAIAAYNAGVGNVLRGYIPTGYVGKWQSALARWERAL